MGGILIFAAALAAFGIGAGCVLLYVAFRRTERHRAALINAHARIVQLERQMAALTFGAAPQLAPEAAPTEALGAAPAPASIETPAEAAPAKIVAIAPAPEPAAHEPVATAAPPPLAPHFPPRIPASTPEPASTLETVFVEAEESKGGGFLRIDALVAVAALISAASLLSVRLGLAPPLVGVALAAFAGAGLLLLAEHRRHNGPHADWIALFGLTAIALALTVGRTSVTAAPPLAYMLGAGALAFCGLLLSVWYGRALLAFGLAIGLAAPAFSLVDSDAPARLALTFAIALGVVIRARAIGAPLWSWLAFAGALAWGAHAVARGGDVLNLASAAGFAAGMLVLVLAYGWKDAAEPLTPDLRREGLLTAHAAMAPALAMLFALVLFSGALAAIGATGLLFAALAVGCAAIARPGYAPATLAVAATSALAIAYWPATEAFDMRATGAAALALGAIFLFCGAAITMRGVWLGAALGALGPVAILFAAQARMAAEFDANLWALAAGALAVTGTALYGPARAQSTNAGSLVAMGAALAAVCIVGFFAPAPWPPVVAALALPALVAFNSRWPEPGVRAAAVVTAAFLALLIGALNLSGASPAARGMIYIVAACAAFAAMRMCYAEQARSLSGDLIFAAALLSLAVALSGEARRAYALAPADQQLFEAGYQSCVWIALALTLALRFGPTPRWQLRAFEGVVFAGAVLVAFVAGGVVLNPWWGLLPESAPGWTGANALLIAYAAPAALFAAYALARARHGWTLRAAIAAGCAAALALTNVVLEIRRAFHGADMDSQAASQNEALAYAIAAAALLVTIIGAALIYRRRALPPPATPAKTVAPAASAPSEPARERRQPTAAAS